MPEKSIKLAVFGVLVLLAGLTYAHEIHFKDGRIIKTKSCWEENGVVKYERYGGILTVKKEIVKEIIYKDEPVIAPKKTKVAAGDILEEQATLSGKRTKLLSSAEIFRLCKPAVVIVKCGKGLGSGFAISSRGHILTNHHVIRSGSDVTVRLPSDEKYAARVISNSDQSDIALLKIDKTGLPYLAIRKSISEKIVGKEVFAIGNPGGLQFSITRGIISQVRTFQDVKYIQTDTPINPGNSGGPLIDQRGNVVGMNTFKRAHSSGLNFAISSDYLFKWVEGYSRHGIVHHADRNSEEPSEKGRVIIIPMPF